MTEKGPPKEGEPINFGEHWKNRQNRAKGGNFEFPEGELMITPAEVFAMATEILAGFSYDSASETTKATLEEQRKLMPNQSQADLLMAFNIYKARPTFYGEAAMVAAAEEFIKRFRSGNENF